MVVLGPSGVSFPNELLLLLYLLLGAQDACRLSQVSRAWQQFVKGHLASRRHAWRHGVSLLSWAEKALARVRHRCAAAGHKAVLMHSFVPVALPTIPSSMASSAALERVFSSRCIHVRCCFIPDGAPGNSCNQKVAARTMDDLWAHLKTVHGVDRGAYLERARALKWAINDA